MRRGRLVVGLTGPALKPVVSLARTLWAVEPVGQNEQAKNHEHDDEDVFDFHGCSFLRQGVG
jgi:hypothetical protein